MFGAQDWLKQQLARRAWLGVVWPLFGFFAVTLVLSLALLTHLARQQDRAFAETTTQLVSNAIAERSTAVGELTLDYANWDAAYQALTGSFDQGWLSENYYSSVIDGVIVVADDGQSDYAWYSDRLTSVASMVTRSSVQAADSLASASELMRAPEAAGTWRSGFVSLNGELALIGVAPIAPEDDARRIALAEAGAPIYRMVGVSLIDAQDVAALGETLALSEFRFEPASAQPLDGRLRMALAGENGGVVGYLTWRNEKPGSAGFAQMAGLIAASLMLAAALAGYIARRLVLALLDSSAREEAALESSRHKSEFIATMSHELRTPLNAIIGYAELIEEETRDQKADLVTMRSDAGRVRAAAEHLTRLIGDILDQSRIDAGLITLTVETLSVSDLLSEVKELGEPLARKNGNRLILAIDSRAAHVVADHGRVLQCLINLVGNAAKFTKDGTITLSPRPVSRDGASLVAIDVVDTGIGVASTDLARLFSPFVQASPEIQRRYGGAGLGLSITRKLAVAMNGDVVAESELGKGSTFTLLLPAAAQSMDDSAPRSVSTI